MLHNAARIRKRRCGGRCVNGQPRWQPTTRQKAALWTALIVFLLLVSAYSFEGLGFGESVRQLEPYQNLRRAKTPWDWLQLLGAPAAIAFGVYWLGARQTQRERELQDQRAQEEAVQAYLDQMSHLLLEKRLRASREGDEVRILARAQTLTVLARLDPERKSSVLQFLYETNLINKDAPVVKLGGISMLGFISGSANLKNIDLSFSHMANVDLSGTDLEGAHLAFAMLTGANLSETNLNNADLGNADLTEANLRSSVIGNANLEGAFLTGADLRSTNLWNSNLSEAHLDNADLQDAELAGSWVAEMIGERPENSIGDADLTDADLTQVNLLDANITKDQLESCGSLKGAIMPDGTTHN
jgi:uncharacterized protein YjbI with pentapeptide repeats